MSSNRLNILNGESAPFCGKLLYVSASTYEGEWESVCHTHPFSELFYVVGGQGRFVVEGETFAVGPEDMVIVNPNVEHTEQSYQNNPLSYVVLAVADLAFLFPGGAEGDPPCYRKYHFQSQGRKIRSYLDALMEEASARQENYAVISQSLLEVLLTLLQRTADFSITPAAQAVSSRECAFARRYIDGHYHESIGLEELAEMTHLNKFYFAHAFARYYGVSPIRYLIQKRIAVSQDLLSTTNYDIAYIARQLGFSSQSYFSQAFKRETGVSPAAYRRRARNG